MGFLHLFTSLFRSHMCSILNQLMYHLTTVARQFEHSIYVPTLRKQSLKEYSVEFLM